MSQRVNQIIGITSLFLVVSLVCSCAKVSFVEPYEGAVGTGTLSIRVSVGDENPLTEGVYPSSQRTIAPSQLTQNELTGQNYTFKLTGENRFRTLPEQTITLTNGGTSLIGIPSGSWQLKLVAYDNQNRKALEGVAGVTVEDGEVALASFVLKPIEGGTGDVNVQFTLDNSDFTLLNSSGATVEIGLYDTLDYSLITTTNRRPTLARTLTYSLTGIDAGIYILRVTFTAGTNNSTALKPNSTATWVDTLRIEGTRETSANLTLPQLLKKPTAPTSATFSIDNAATTGHIPVSFIWASIYNANSYELEVLEYTGNAPTTDNDWNGLAGNNANSVTRYNAIPDDTNNYLKHTNKFASQYYMGEGGLLPGQNTIKLALEVSLQSYAARVRATNSYGESAWMYFTFRQTATHTQFPTIQLPAAPTNFDFTAGGYDNTTQSFLTTLTWEDNATNEDGYELQFRVFTANNIAIPSNDNAWNAIGTPVTTYRGGNLTAASGEPLKYEGGSLLANSTFAQVSIKRHTGVEYYAVRIRSYNRRDSSPWVYPSGQVDSIGRKHPKLLMPHPYLTYTSTQASGGTFSATIRVQDILGSTCFYQYELIRVSQMDFVSIFNKTDLAQKNAEWTRIYNTTPSFQGRARPDNQAPTFTIAGLTEGSSIIIRVRISTLQNRSSALSATPWNYYIKNIVPGKTN